jgi:predicted GNAT family acetyltransferase
MKTVFTDEKDERFLKLVEELDYGYYKRIGDELKKYEQYNEFNDPHFVILLLESERAIACASYRACGKDSVEFKRVYVKKEYRKRGIAFCIIRKLEENAIENGFRDSYIVTGKNNYAAIGLYEKLDYEKIAKFGQFKDDETVICMKKCFR